MCNLQFINFKRVKKLLNRKTILILILCILTLLALGVIVKFGLARRGLANSGGEFSDLVVENTPTLAITSTPTPTPTLTLQQITEIERKKFNQLNQKYGPCKSVPILMYHHVLEAKIAADIHASGLNVAPETFRSQVDFLIAKGYQVIGLDELPGMLASGNFPAKPVILTFDDGYRDFYTQVFPILKEKNIKATVFVISQFVGGERYLVWSQIREMANSGLVLIGDHTLNHLPLQKLNKEDETNQIISAKNVIESNIGKPVRFFAYPYGSSNQITKEVLKENGFGGAVTTVPGRTQCAGLPYDWQRIRIGGAVLSKYGL